MENRGLQITSWVRSRSFAPQAVVVSGNKHATRKWGLLTCIEVKGVVHHVDAPGVGDKVASTEGRLATEGDSLVGGALFEGMASTTAPEAPQGMEAFEVHPEGKLGGKLLYADIPVSIGLSVGYDPVCHREDSGPDGHSERKVSEDSEGSSVHILI